MNTVTPTQKPTPTGTTIDVNDKTAILADNYGGYSEEEIGNLSKRPPQKKR